MSRQMKIDGLPVADAHKSLVIQITASDCKKGSNKEPGSCAAAQALMRQEHVPAVRVHIAKTYVKQGKRWVRYQTPAALRQEIISFDRGTGFAPGEYTLRAIPPSERNTGYRTGGKDKKRTKPKRARAKPHFVEGVRARPGWELPR